MFTGTLCGKWPDIGVWSCLVGMKDKHGHIDCTPQYLAGVLGLEVDALLKCIDRFMQPDPFSRTRDCDGRRLELIDPARPWGWKVVNHTKYQEKARKQGHDQRRQESGENAARMAERRQDPTRPDATRDNPLSTQRNSNTTQEEERAPARELPPAGLNLQAWNRFAAYRSEIRKPIKPASVQAAQRKLAGFGPDQAAVVEQTVAQGWTGLFALKDDANGARRNGGQPRISALERVRRANEAALNADPD